MKKFIKKFVDFVQHRLYSYGASIFLKRKMAVLKSTWLSSVFYMPVKNCMFWGKVFLKDPHRISLGEGNSFGDNLYLTAWSQFSDKKAPVLISIGSHCDFGAFNHITATNQIVIGDNCLTGKWVTISDNNHGTTSFDDLSLPPLKRKVVSK